MYKVRRIGILGGTFNPIHLGHLALADEARQLLHLAKVIFIPVHLPPHKKVGALPPAQERYHMVSLAIKSNPFFEVSNIELKRGGISYSVETIQELKSHLSHTNLYFIVGSDFLKEFSTWKDIDRLSKICKFAIAQRPGYTFTPPLCNKRAGFQKVLKNMQAITVSALDISSTDIRKRIKVKRSIRYLVPEKVRNYILKRKLYR